MEDTVPPSKSLQSRWGNAIAAWAQNTTSRKRDTENSTGAPKDVGTCGHLQQKPESSI